MRRSILSAIVAVVSGCLGTSTVTRARAHELVAHGAHLVDVRSPSEFAERHAAPAINIPLEVLAARMDELGDKRVPVIVYCHTGVRAAIAARRLQQAGFTVYNLGTLGHWNVEPVGASPTFE